MSLVAPIIYSRTKNIDYSLHLTFCPEQNLNNKFISQRIIDSLEDLSNDKPMIRLLLKENNSVVYGITCDVSAFFEESDYAIINDRRNLIFVGVAYKLEGEVEYYCDDRLIKLYEKNIKDIWNLPIEDDTNGIVETQFQYMAPCETPSMPKVKKWFKKGIKKMRKRDRCVFVRVERPVSKKQRSLFLRPKK